MGCVKWRRRFQAFWMSTDEKPKKKDRRLIEKQNRQEAKEDIKEEMGYDLGEDLDKEHELNKEAEEAFKEAEEVFKEFEGDK